jgi:predicted  nucleic acid-binding Zn-ribbon protein
LRSLPLERSRSIRGRRSANLEATKDRARHVEVEKKVGTGAGTRNDSITRLKTQQYETRKNDEFSAIGREIERYQNEISALEDQELELMVQADVLKAQIATEERQTAAAKDSIAKQIANLEAKQITLTNRLEELKREKEELAARVNEDLLDRFNRLFASKGDAAVVALEHDVCTGCHMKITTQTAVRVKGGKEIVSCEQCGRILYFAE